MVTTPYTRWHGDQLHGKTKVLTAVWVRLDAIYVRIPGAPHHVVYDGLDMTGEVPGRLHSWFQTAKGDWIGVVNYETRYADGRRDHVQVENQLVPAYALRPRAES